MLDSILKWRPEIEEAADRYHLRASLVAGLMEIENQAGDPTATSSAGAVGLGQVMPGERIAGRPSTADLMDPMTNLDWTCRILFDNWKRWGTWIQAIAAYYGAIRSGGDITISDDGSGVTGPGYVQRVLDAQMTYLVLDGYGMPDPDFQQYGETWRDVAVHLKGVADFLSRKLRMIARIAPTETDDQFANVLEGVLL